MLKPKLMVLFFSTNFIQSAVSRNNDSVCHLSAIDVTDAGKFVPFYVIVISGQALPV